ncbi:2-oxoacid:acceptor oxidoreductase family protein [Helicobacter trogontum]|uniref:2-oxoglutarate-acceptor oxidoreductase subunit OorC n=1 Tax=Helicobacter trogontum TaxID=50960 RepID=A0A099VFH4_9HELI|nr:2-oxoacid:acceptor oxidoreductase family protein [Helicobacter trogontum]MCI5786494.1 2-oxoacid:acceptor oxidoreductase family protein [Helicobacter trogontum]MDY5185117.1 2-oxoacid:acceptor oxidoreductase family protein [Helicobacter trogontum]TLD81189.1 2-oxoglutarate:acceptor oxidoreductase [Helicobacter trogontum]TLD97956.1 2-oxoglutarate:acceptor oxidoreductase [Helicobacter trogontum]
MEHQLRFTGVGGQGVLLAGEILAEAKIRGGGYGVKASTYTSQVRGGPTKVDILLDSEDILYPYAMDGNIDFMLSVAQMSYDIYKSGIKEQGIVVLEPNLVKPTDEDRQRFRIYEIPIITIAKEEVGNVVTQSVVALAATVTFTNCVSEELVIETMLSKVPAKVADLNKKAYELGKKYALECLNK